MRHLSERGQDRMEIFPFVDGEAVEIRDSKEREALAVELRDLLDGLNLPRATVDKLAALIEDQEREAARLAFVAGVRAGDLHAHIVGRLRRRE